MENQKTESLCENVEFRKSMSNFAIFLVVTLIIISWATISQLTKKRQVEAIKQTAIAQALDASGTAMIVLDENAKVLFWDENAVKMFGFTSMEIVNKSIDTVVPHGKEHEELVGDYLSNKNATVKIIMCEGQKKDGQIIPLSLRVQPKFKDKQVLVFADVISESTYTER